MFSLVIAGGREFVGTEEDFKLISKLCIRYNITEIVSGRARGADQFGEICAERLGLPVKYFPADWNRHGKSAGYIRNAEMARYTDYVHCFPGGKGTQHMINLTIKYSKILI
ncbi:MAG: SLOG family protein [Candidatus Delongbacteria bacterium]|jgi:hypothetical protein|nr:SLOG family protein [Candidatus Delongbacteria bacterium]